jgi:hypothetical protein
LAKDITRVVAKDIIKDTAKDIVRHFHKLEAADFILVHRLDSTKDNFPKGFDYFTL